jgi:cytochrome c biogenesis factor
MAVALPVFYSSAIGLFDIFLTFVAIAATQHFSQDDVCYNSLRQAPRAPPCLTN